MGKMTCPACQAGGLPVKPVTIDALARDTVLDRLRTRAGFGYCPTADCPVAWFQPETGEIVDKSDLTVRIGMKETTGPRPICYCFGHDAVDLEAEIQANGRSEIPAQIAAKCGQGLGRCEETNPQGSCCLGNVNRIIREASPDRGDSPFPTLEIE